MKSQNKPPQQIDTQYPAELIGQAIKKQERIIYSTNGNRAQKPSVFLKKLENIYPRAGITRIADISNFLHFPYPVFQSCRPNIMYSPAYGQNTGSQGKGPTRTQAKISCIMESLESFCVEPRNLSIILGSYNFLKSQHCIACPEDFILSRFSEAPSRDAVIPWTAAYSIQHKSQILVPAKMVYFPFLHEDYSLPGHYSVSTSGVGAGSTYYEAILHGLYELIESHYERVFLDGQIKIEAIYEQEIQSNHLQKYLQKANPEYELQLYALEIPTFTKNIPMILALLVSSDQCFDGWGCAGEVSIAIDRAVSEAFQSLATQISGAREDLYKSNQNAESLFSKTQQPSQRSLRIKDYQKRVHNRIFKTLNQEFDFLRSWLKRAGYSDIYIANLTRYGIDIPVVRVIVPNMTSP